MGWRFSDNKCFISYENQFNTDDCGQKHMSRPDFNRQGHMADMCGYMNLNQCVTRLIIKF